MKVDLNTTTMIKPKTNFFSKVRKFIATKIKPLGKDTFETSATKKSEKKIIISRKHPNWCDAPEDGYRNNTIARTRCYYPDDLKKMESMTKEEQHEYKDYLDEIGRFYYDDNYHVDAPELDEFFKRHNISLEKYIVKDE